MLYGLTFISMLRAAFNFTKMAQKDNVADEEYHRLQTIFSKNQYGYTTRFMSQFEIFLEAILNERFLDESTAYQEDESIGKEVEDQENGLASDFALSDVRNLVRDKGSDHHASFKSLRQPARVGTNYAKSDDLSCYKILPKGQMPPV